MTQSSALARIPGQSLASQGLGLPQKRSVAAEKIIELPSESVQVRNVRSLRMYQAAMVDRLTADWDISVTSANAQILVSRKAVISRCRELARDNPFVKRAISLFQNNVVGHQGIKLQEKIKKADKTLDLETNQAISDAWELSGRRENCAANRTLNRTELLRMAVGAVIRDGGILFRKRRAFKNDFSYALEPIEIDRLDHDFNRPTGADGNMVQFGIEFDDFGAPIFYHILTRHPGDVFAYRSSPQYREKIPANEIIPVWDVERAGQIVGMPRLHAVCTRLSALGKYDQAELVAAWLASCKAGVLERDSESGSYVGEKDERGNTINEIQPGMVEELPMGLKYKAIDPQHPTNAYPFFVKSQLRAIASGIGICYPSLSSDLEGVNFTSIRAGYLEDREEYKTLQSLIIDQLLVPWFEDWISFAIMSGQLKLPMSGVAEYKKCATWKARRWESVQPFEETQAALLAINGGIDTRTNIIGQSEYPGDAEALFEEQKQDMDAAKKYGLTFTTEKPSLAKNQESGANPGDPNASNQTTP